MQTQLAANIRENSAITNALFRKDFVALKAKLFDAVRYVAPLTRISKRNEKKHARVEKKSQCGEGFFHLLWTIANLHLAVCRFVKRDQEPEARK